MPVKNGNKTPYETVRSDIIYAFKDANFDNVKMVFYDGTKKGLTDAYDKAMSSADNSAALCLAYVDSNQIDEESFTEHNEKNVAFKWIREDISNGVSVKELFMHVALGLTVLDCVKNSSDAEHKRKLIEIIERLVDNDEKEVALLKADLNNIFSFSFILKLKKITRIDINSQMRQRMRSLEEIFTAA
mgnify:FL=1